jgi:hypothetical protein
MNMFLRLFFFAASAIAVAPATSVDENPSSLDSLAALRDSLPEIINPQSQIASPTVAETRGAISGWFEFSRVCRVLDMKPILEYFLLEPVSGEECMKILVNRYDPLMRLNQAAFSAMYYLEKEYRRVAVSLLVTPGHDDVVDAIFSNLKHGRDLARKYIRNSLPGSPQSEHGSAELPRTDVQEVLARILSSYSGRRTRKVGVKNAKRALGLRPEVALTVESIEDAFGRSASVLINQWTNSRATIPSTIIIALGYLRKAKTELDEKATDRMEE